MTFIIIIIICVLLLLAYVFDITSRFTRIPSVILLLLTGFILSHGLNLLSFYPPDMSRILPLLGTIGLILIVLEGSLEVELNASKFSLISKSFFVAFFPMIIMSVLLAFFFQYISGAGFKDCLSNAIPFSVISSAVAISSAKYLHPYFREFVTYESSLSDIIGVLFFNLIVRNDILNFESIGWFFLQVILIAIISFFATMGLSWLLSKISHSIKFAPVLLLAILIYAVAEIYHLPALVFILLFGLFLGNLDEISHVKWIRKLKPVQLNKEIHQMKLMLTEATFLVRSLFFLLFGFMMKAEDILNLQTLSWACSIVLIILIVRLIQLKISGLPVLPLLFMAPRGLINILLFLTVSASVNIAEINSSLMIQVIVITALVMMTGFIFSRKSIPSEKITFT